MSESASAPAALPEFAAPTAELTPPAAVPFFVVGIPKLIAMSLATFGLYQLYWFYKHWQRLARYGGEDVWPAVRAVFSIVFSFMLFARIINEADEQGTPSFFQPFFLLLLYFTANASIRLGVPFWLAMGLTLVPLVIAQRIVNGLPTVQALPKQQQNTRFTLWNWGWTGTVAALTALSIVLPEPPAEAVSPAPAAIDALVADDRRTLPRPLGDGLVLEQVVRSAEAVELNVRLTNVVMEEVGRRDVLGPVHMTMLQRACSSEGLEAHLLEAGAPLRYTFVDRHQRRLGVMTLTSRMQCAALAP